MSPEPSTPPAPWPRLDQHDAGLPIPAVYVPQRDLAPATPAALAFAPVGELVAAGSNMPFARSLIADISDPERLALFVYDPDASRPTGNGGQHQVETTPLVTGTFTTPAPPEWGLRNIRVRSCAKAPSLPVSGWRSYGAGRA